jgi:hypothetical protein
MKPSTTEVPITVEEKADGPLVSFSHLSSSFASEDILNYGFPASQEEDLYETGYLCKIFLRC